jgi:hypothetical protein
MLFPASIFCCFLSQNNGKPVKLLSWPSPAHGSCCYVVQQGNPNVNENARKQSPIQRDAIASPKSTTLTHSHESSKDSAAFRETVSLRFQGQRRAQPRKDHAATERTDGVTLSQEQSKVVGKTATPLFQTLAMECTGRAAEIRMNQSVETGEEG